MNARADRRAIASVLAARREARLSIDVLHCPHCGARRKLIARIPFETTHRVVSIPLRGTGAYLTDLLVARRNLRHLGLECDAPAIAAARPPPQTTFGF